MDSDSPVVPAPEKNNLRPFYPRHCAPRVLWVGVESILRYNEDACWSDLVLHVSRDGMRTYHSSVLFSGSPQAHLGRTAVQVASPTDLKTPEACNDFRLAIDIAQQAMTDLRRTSAMYAPTAVDYREACMAYFSSRATMARSPDGPEGKGAFVLYRLSFFGPDCQSEPESQHGYVPRP